MEKYFSGLDTYINYENSINSASIWVRIEGQS